jgi:hypothetical protein
MKTNGNFFEKKKQAGKEREHPFSLCFVVIFQFQAPNYKSIKKKERVETELKLARLGVDAATQNTLLVFNCMTQ